MSARLWQAIFQLDLDYEPRLFSFQKGKAHFTEILSKHDVVLNNSPNDPGEKIVARGAMVSALGALEKGFSDHQAITFSFKEFSHEILQKLFQNLTTFPTRSSVGSRQEFPLVCVVVLSR